MTSTRFNYDECRTRKRLQQSVDVGNYHLNVPGNGLNPFYIEDPSIRLQKWGGNIWLNTIDIDSNLKGMDKQLKCDTMRNIAKLKPDNSYKKMYPSSNKLNVDYSRHSNPAWNIRGMELNNSQYLLYDPQVKSHIPFVNNISSRIYHKDLYSRENNIQF